MIYIYKNKEHVIVSEEEQKSHTAQPTDQSKLQKCKFLMNQAQDADEAGLKDIAVKLYTDAAELGLSMVHKTIVKINHIIIILLIIV